MKQALLYKKLPAKSVQCQNCAHYCVIQPDKTGICGVRENKDGKLYSLVYGKACAVNIDPIEKKPFFHFLPGTQSLSIATVGCQFACKSCQNWTISQGPKLFGRIEGQEISPKEIVKIALKNNVPSISYTYTDPTVFLEYALDTMKLAKKQGLKNTWVTAGFFSEQALNLVSPYLDAVNVDLKSFENEFYIKYCGGQLQPVLDTLKRLKRKKIWTEITTLIIPGLNDKQEIFKKIAKFIKQELGPETPWHISRFSGSISWKLQHIPDTPVGTIKKAYNIGKQAGLKYVYSGNIPGLSLENTYCSKCQTLAIQRVGYSISRFDKNNKCPKCGENLFIL